MTTAIFKTLLCIYLLCMGAESVAQEKAEDRHMEVVMRMIGHQVLLGVGDSTSRVLPIEKVDDRFRIGFGSEFQFNPEDLLTSVDRVVKETHIAKRYIIEVENCETTDIVYSYEAGTENDPSIIPCRSRDQPMACYTLLFSILESEKPDTTGSTLDASGVTPTSRQPEKNDLSLIFVLLGSVVLTGILAFIWKKRNASGPDLNTVAIGDFRFDRRKMTLSFKDEKIELSGKECDLLQLLYDSANDTVERDTILKMVWDDEGDYVGRTLDVFISKLRKKLEADSNVKIVNIRGVGYKLVV